MKRKVCKKKYEFKKVFVVTSSIAVGKSEFLKLAKKANIYTISADLIAHKIFVKKIKKIKNKFQLKISNIKEIKKTIAKIIFSNKNHKKILEKIMHKRIKKDIFIEIKNNKNKIIFVEIPLFFENLNYTKILNKIVIYTDLNTQLTRLMKRNNINKDLALKMINSQIATSYKIKYATYKINNFDYDVFKKEALKIITQIKESNGVF